MLLNKVQLVTFPHIVAAAYMTAGAFVAGNRLLARLRGSDGEVPETFRRGVRTGAAVMLVAGIGVAISGDTSGKIMTEVQPMKMAAAEGALRHHHHAPFSLLTVGSLNGEHHRAIIEVPGLLSFLGTGSSTARSRASTTCALSTRPSTAPTRARSTTRRATTRRSSRSRTGRSAS